MVQTEYVFLIDVDFVPSVDLQTQVDRIVTSGFFERKNTVKINNKIFVNKFYTSIRQNIVSAWFIHMYRCIKSKLNVNGASIYFTVQSFGCPSVRYWTQFNEFTAKQKRTFTTHQQWNHSSFSVSRNYIFIIATNTKK